MDFSANVVVFSEPDPLPDKFQGLINFINKKLSFSKTKINERTELDYDGIGFFSIKLSEKHLYGCLVEDQTPKRRFIYNLLENLYDKITALPEFKSKSISLNSNIELRKSIQLLVNDFNKGKSDTNKKIRRTQEMIEQKAIDKIEEEKKKMDELMEIKTEADQTEIHAADNLDQAKIVKKEAFILNAKMWLLVYGSSLMITAFCGFIFIHHFL